MSDQRDDDERNRGGKPLLYGKALQVRLSPELLERIKAHGRGDFLSEKIRDLIETEIGNRERKARRRAVRATLAASEGEDKNA